MGSVGTATGWMMGDVMGPFPGEEVDRPAGEVDSRAAVGRAVLAVGSRTRTSIDGFWGGWQFLGAQ